MKPFRFLILACGLLAAFGAQSIVGRSEQGPASAPAAAGAGPFDALHFRPLGPAGMSGRIADLAVYEPNPAIFYVGSAHGGVWKTTNGGTTFEAQFQHQGLISIGDVTVSQSNPDLVWVGSGESNNRQSTSWGDGVYKSLDGGKTYTRVGLPTSRAINRIVIDPRNNDVVFVAATGSLWGPGGERGVYKTTDGGRTWKQVLKVDDDTGANDLVMDPANDKILYASTYQRRRTPCCMNGGGPGSGVWKSTDAGETWTRVKGNGFPDGPLGRIGLDVYRKRPNILYAVIEGPVPQEGRGSAGSPQAGRGGAGTPDEAPQPPPGRSNIATTVTPNTVTGVYRSDDGGTTWRKVNDENPRPMYFSQIRIDPNDPDVIIYGGVKLHYSTDGGKTVSTNATQTIHDDVHAIWIDPANSQHVLIGNDGGLAVSWDQTKTWNFFNNLPIGLFYHVSVDMATP
ncbi:MAG: glycosyl hydrolase, partial [Acidobacteria bacterium]|nr:glycosyl hydrolase [Acidobacteriota bacterium]